MYATKTVSSQTTSPWIPLDDNQAAFNVSLAVTVTGSLTYTVEFTLDNIQDPSITPTAFPVPTLTGYTASASSTLWASVKAVRLNVTAFSSGSAILGVRQGTSWDGVNFAATPVPQVLFQSGIPFWLPPGDGAANGLSFTGVRGTFTLSAEAPLTGASAYLTSGCYVYLPAGSGGLVNGEWYWCVMSSATAGEVYAETYTQGSGKPRYISSPTALPNLTAGYITQVLSEITVVTFTLPANSMGPNGEVVAKLRYVTTNSTNIKRVRLKVGSGNPAWVLLSMTNTFNLLQIQATIQNMGRIDRQHGLRISSTAMTDAYDCGTTATTYAGNVKSENTATDLEVKYILQLTANTDSIIMIPAKFTVQYGE